MSSLHEFFSMGGYAVYVWSAYGIAFVVMAGSAWAAVRGLKRASERAIRQLEEEQ
jgi:heme exporter protein D